MAAESLLSRGKVTSISQSAAISGTVGAVLGGSVSAVINTYKVARGEWNSTEAVVNVAKETVGTGISTAPAAAATTALGLGGILGLAGFLFVASVTKGLWDSACYGAGKRAPSKPA